MDRIEWSESYSVGDPTIDAQHRHLAALINAVVDGIDSGVRSAHLADSLDAVTRYATAHFTAEEELLAAAGYPDLEGHREEHQAFTEQAAVLCLDTMNGDAAVPRRLADFLVAWWHDHVLHQDMAYRDHLRKHGGNTRNH